MNKRDVIKYCLTLPNTFEDYPFQDDTVSVVMKHTNNKENNTKKGIISERS